MNSTEPIRVLIVDDHAMVRKGLISFLKNDPALELVGEARDGREAIEACELLKPEYLYGYNLRWRRSLLLS